MKERVVTDPVEKIKRKLGEAKVNKVRGMVRGWSINVSRRYD